MGGTRGEARRAESRNGVLGRGQPAQPIQLGGLRERSSKLPRAGTNTAEEFSRSLSQTSRKLFGGRGSAVRFPFSASQYVVHTVCVARYYVFLGGTYISISPPRRAYIVGGVRSPAYPPLPTPVNSGPRPPHAAVGLLLTASCLSTIVQRLLLCRPQQRGITR